LLLPLDISEWPYAARVPTKSGIPAFELVVGKDRGDLNGTYIGSLSNEIAKVHAVDFDEAPALAPGKIL
jgi:hypothetical protein